MTIVLSEKSIQIPRYLVYSLIFEVEYIFQCNRLYLYILLININIRYKRPTCLERNVNN